MKTKLTVSKGNTKFQLIRIFILAVLVICNNAGSALAKVPDLSKEIGIIAHQKSEAEGLMSQLNIAYKKKKISYQQYMDGINYYTEAKADYDGWISELQAKIMSGGQLDKAKYKVFLKKAGQKAILFGHYAANCLGLRPLVGERGIGEEAGSFVGNVVIDLVKAGLEIWNAIQHGNQQEKEELCKKLNQQRWKPFDQVQ